MSLESLIDAITSPDLADDDYSALLDLVELVNKSPIENSITSVRLLKVKLQSPNANTLLRSITLLDFLAENCGAMVKASIATPEFVNNYLLSILNDSIIHISIKYEVVKEIYKLSKSFKNDDSLYIMKETFQNLKRQFPSLTSQAIDEIDNNNKTIHSEDDDLQLKKAIELSLKDNVTSHQQTLQPPTQMNIQLPPQQNAPNQFQSFLSPPANVPPQNAPPLSPQLSNNSFQPNPHIELQEDPNKPDKYVALYDLISDDDDTLSFQKDDIITIVEQINPDWLRGCLNGKVGIVPVNYIKKIPKTLEKDLFNLVDLLNNSFDIESTLSQLLDLNRNLKNSNISSKEFENILMTKNFPSKIQKIESVKSNLKSIIELHNLKLLELKALQSNLDNSLKIYQDLIKANESNTVNSSSISQFVQTYPDLSQQTSGISQQFTSNFPSNNAHGNY